MKLLLPGCSTRIVSLKPLLSQAHPDALSGITLRVRLSGMLVISIVGWETST